MPMPDNETVGRPEDRNFFRATSHNPAITMPANMDMRMAKAMFPAFNPAPMTHCSFRAPGNVAMRWYWNTKDAMVTSEPRRIEDRLLKIENRDVGDTGCVFVVTLLYRSDPDYAR